jgi:lysozyme
MGERKMNLSLMAEELERDEGVRFRAYTDTTGHLTIGVGRNLDNNPLTPEEIAYVGHDARTKPIARRDAEFLLTNDIKNLSLDLNRRMSWWKELDEVRRRVILNMAFNLGITRLLEFKETLRWMQQGHYQAASMCMLESVWANQVGERAERLVRMMRSGKV